MSFLKYESSEHNLKINYPATWEKGDNKTSVVPPPFVVVFAIPVERPPALYQEFVGVSITSNDTNSINELMEQHVASIRKLNSEVIESSLTTIVGMPAYQIVYIENGVKILAVVTTKGNKAFAITYFSRPEKYQEYLSTVEQMIGTFEFF